MSIEAGSLTPSGRTTPDGLGEGTMVQASSGAVVITTINPPTRTVSEARRLAPTWDVVVVGDRRTPPDWAHPDVTFLSLADQDASQWALAADLPVGHYARKNLGYLHAMASGVPVIAETDDDNFPYDHFLADVGPRVRARPVERAGWANVYRCFTDAHVWPRGLPLEQVRDGGVPPLGEEDWYDCPVQQFLADGDPDVDAVYRLVLGDDVRFDRDVAVVLPPGTHCPFNSQNTVWFPDAWPLLYLPSHVSFRMTDIWRSFVAGRCLAAAGRHLAFLGPTVFQERNAHDLLRDFAGEVDGYLHNDRIVRALAELSLDGADPAADLRRCYECLVELEVVPAAELALVDAWLADVATAAS